MVVGGWDSDRSSPNNESRREAALHHVTGFAHCDRPLTTVWARKRNKEDISFIVREMIRTA